MTKDEMKNRISMALKDPTLQQGFEIICKENAELKEQIENLEGIKLSQGSALEKEYMINESLKVDNAKLKERNSELAGQKASLQRWLGEARAIIKGLLESCFGPTSKTVNYEVKARAEQFLKEE